MYLFILYNSYKPVLFILSLIGVFSDLCLLASILRSQNEKEGRKIQAARRSTERTFPKKEDNCEAVERGREEFV